MSEDPPELRAAPEEAPYERGPGMRLAMRVTGVVAVIALVIPGVVGTIELQALTAQELCERITAARVGGTAQARVELRAIGPGGPGWYCVAVRYGDRELELGNLGMIPG